MLTRGPTAEVIQIDPWRTILNAPHDHPPSTPRYCSKVDSHRVSSDITLSARALDPLFRIESRRPHLIRSLLLVWLTQANGIARHSRHRAAGQALKLLGLLQHSTIYTLHSRSERVKRCNVLRGPRKPVSVVNSTYAAVAHTTTLTRRPWWRSARRWRQPRSAGSLRDVRGSRRICRASPARTTCLMAPSSLRYVVDRLHLHARARPPPQPLWQRQSLTRLRHPAIRAVKCLQGRHPTVTHSSYLSLSPFLSVPFRLSSHPSPPLPAKQRVGSICPPNTPSISSDDYSALVSSYRENAPSRLDFPSRLSCTPARKLYAFPTHTSTPRRPLRRVSSRRISLARAPYSVSLSHFPPRVSNALVSGVSGITTDRCYDD